MDLILFGIQGSGKGTQAKRLAEEFGYDIFEAGGELRAIAASGSELGNTVSEYMNRGELVPHEIIINVLKEAIAKRPADQKILFDGIPRDNVQQADFDKIMNEIGRDVRCIQIVVNMEDCVQRILKRAEKDGRADDASEETVRKRMDTFLTKTMPVIEEYKAAGKLVEVDGEGAIDDVYERVREVVDSGE